MIRDKIVDAISLVSDTPREKVRLDFPENEDFGDYSTNVALMVFADPHRKLHVEKIRAGKPSIQDIKSPREFAEILANWLRNDKKLSDIVEKIEVAGPGFINFWLRTDVLVDNLIQISREEEDYGKGDWGKGKTVVIDYSSPNIAKRFSIGHLRSTIIGQALYNLYKFSGWNAIGDNHLGDWGTQFGVLIYMVEREKLDPEKLKVDDWEKLYVDFHKEAETNEDLKNVAAEAFKRLEDGDPSARKIWQAALDTSLKEYNRIYDLLGVKIDYAYGESSYESRMLVAIEKAKEKGILVKSKGAWVIEFDKKYNLPSNVLVKSNGATTYLTRDLALLFFRKEKWDPDLQIFEVGAEQSLYFKQVFAMAEMMGLFRLDQLKHVGHGLYRFKEGKMSTREGKTIKLEDVLSEALKRASRLTASSGLARSEWGKPEELIPRKLEVDRSLSIGSRDSDIQSIAVGALKYNDLKRDPRSEIIFDWGEILNMEGNSGPYLQYTTARANSVLRKAEFPISNFQFPINLQINSEESSVLRSLIKFSGIVENAAKSYSPNLLCNYLYDLAQKFNGFYNADRIIGSENEEFRLALTDGVGQILKNGLHLLGIQTPEKM